jgi:hypothetical protein
VPSQLLKLKGLVLIAESPLYFFAAFSSSRIQTPVPTNLIENRPGFRREAALTDLVDELGIHGLR